MKRIAIIATLLCSILAARAQSIHEGIVFAKVPTTRGGIKELKLNIYKGDGDGIQPTVLFVHGGAWIDGSNDMIHTGSQQIRTLMNLRARGITIAACTYRFSAEGVFPAQIHDVKGAIRFLKAHAAEYGIDPERILIMGESAGAQLALLAAVTGRDPDDAREYFDREGVLEGAVGGNTEYSSRVAGCIDCYGMTDFTTLAADLYARPDLGRTDPQIYELVEAPESSRSMLFGLTTDECNLGTVVNSPELFPQEYALVQLGSPVFHASADDPPVLIINGQRDMRVPTAQAYKMYERLYSAGAKAELILVSNAPHGNLGTTAVAAITDFVCRTLDKH